jgi:hypothetical protein
MMLEEAAAAIHSRRLYPIRSTLGLSKPAGGRQGYGEKSAPRIRGKWRTVFSAAATAY